MIEERLLKYLLLLFLILGFCECKILNQCYSSGTSCIRFEKAYFEFVDTVQLTSDNVPTLKDNAGTTSTRVVLSELLSHLAFNHSWTLAALVVNAGTRTDVQWKIAPDETSEHPIEIDDPDGYDNPFPNATVHCVDIQNYADDAKRFLVVPPNYNFFFSVNGSASINCSKSGISIIPFVWDDTSRASIRGMSYFSSSPCSSECLVLPIPTLLVRFCPNVNNSNLEIHIDKVEDFTAELSDDLLGINIQKVNDSIEFPMGIMNCEVLMENSSILGENPICLGDGANVAIKFGANPKIGILQEVKTKFSPRSAFLKSPKNAVYPNFTVSHEKEVATCSNSTTFEVKQISGNGFMPLSFQWTILNGTLDMETIAKAATERLLEIPSHHLSTNNVILVTGCNVAEKCTSSGPIYTALVDDASVFSVSIDGVEQETPASFGLRLRANPTFKQCSSKTSPKDVQYEWKLNGEGKMYDDGLKLPAYSYSVNELVNVTLIARYSYEKPYSSSSTKTIHYFGLPLLVNLDCAERQIGKDHDLTIRVLAVDQNRKDSSLKYQWTCELIDEKNDTQSCNLGAIDTFQDFLKIPTNKLIENTIMNVTATVSSEEQSDSSSCIVTIAATQIPTVTFYRLAEKKQNAFDYIRIQALVSSSLPTLNITWEVVRDPQFGYFNISSFISNPTTIIKNVPSKSDVFVSFTIPPAGTQLAMWPGLMSGKTFVIRLWASNEKGSSFSDLHLSTNAPPTKGNIDISVPFYPPFALETPVTFSVGDGWNDDKDDLPLTYQFGYRIHYDNNETYEYQGSKSTVKYIQFFLPSTSGNGSDECGERIGITALLTVCDRLGSCNSEESGMFIVEPSKNSSIAALDLISLLNTDVTNGNFISAIAKINALNIELCTENFDESQTDHITMLLFQSLSESSESEEFQIALKAAYSLLPVVSSDILTVLIDVLSNYRELTFKTLEGNTNSRRKRAVNEVQTTAKVYQATESEATDMLKVYDILIGKDKPVVDVFFLNINDFLTGFCVQLDENSKRVMSATGGDYTAIQTQSVNVNRDGYTGVFNVSGPNKLSNITFSSYFASSYSSWNCGSGTSSTCRYVCLGTAWISNQALGDNSYLAEALFLSYIQLSVNKSVSDLHQLSLVDPISGTILTPSNGQFLYSVDIAVMNYKPINYYNCYIYHQNSGWDFRQCVSSIYAKMINNQSFFTCNCSSTGIIGVFLTSGPAPTPLPDHNEILLTLIIDMEVSSDDLAKIFTKIAQLSEVETKRFVKIANKGNKTIQATLRPPFRSDQKSNSVAVQCIQKAVGYQKILNLITVLNFTYSVVNRELNGDSYARKLTFNFLNSYINKLSDDADDYAKKWAQSMATTLQISEYRFKNYKVFFGVVYNITVTLPFTDELKPLSAEEISLMIQECTKYGEFDFQLADESVHLGIIANADITMLMVLHETNSLMIALAVVLSVILGLGTIFICGAVMVKLRTDKLIVEERRRANLNEHQFQLPPPPEYPVDSSVFHVVDQYPLRRQRADDRQF
ncbi:PKD/REJ-like domain-containing protein [Caenorhabditis elegans]|uniref:PKD/REJ-like domain-containing protein n=1 Tax=Caenorhabditis elegans TaxID=6239 RepID=Q20945_CAEEL|nr:PKD/REJ-like domain-containing protein [Caenorhabditis elegans]CAA93471.4 PKD/REJ-like domain-containing protein [Caenorhabditis elegans]|eukprot:NP_509774.3 Uncharacterized protein CELE_F57C7.4 [Caenorhabditis elegans]